MKWRAWLAVVLFGLTWSGALAGESAQLSCEDCHVEAATAFGRSAMSRAASMPTFLAEWKREGEDAACFGCHAPSGGAGVQCRDCHGEGDHPFSKLSVPEICARCHDAPGELTVRSFFQSQAFKDGAKCLDCHTKDQSGDLHGFAGPSRRVGFLAGVARLRASVAARPQGDVAVVSISHSAGHALPGGTSGRAVWLVVEGIDDAGGSAWRVLTRFGWEHAPDEGWTNKTLQPDRVAIVEIGDLHRAGAQRLRASLVYQFTAGEYDAPEAVHERMDEVELSLTSRKP